MTVEVIRPWRRCLVGHRFQPLTAGMADILARRGYVRIVPETELAAEAAGTTQRSAKRGTDAKRRAVNRTRKPG